MKRARRRSWLKNTLDLSQRARRAAALRRRLTAAFVRFHKASPYLSPIKRLYRAIKIAYQNRKS